jgi:hypothetical protein
MDMPMDMPMDMAKEELSLHMLSTMPLRGLPAYPSRQAALERVLREASADAFNFNLNFNFKVGEESDVDAEGAGV